MTAWSEVLSNRTIRGEEALRVPWRLEPLHAPFPLAGGLVGILRAVVEVAVLAMLYTRQDLLFGGPVTLEFICDEHPWHVRQAFEELAEELLGRLLIPPTLDEDIEHMAVLIHRSPQVMAFAVNGQKHFI